MKKLVLASKSPRRREILRNAGYVFDIVKSSYEEELDNKNFSYEKIENLAKNKAFGALINLSVPAFIIGADTVVVLNEKILTKPKDRDDAIKVLESLSGKVHKVVTSICILDSESRKFVIQSTTTNVEFNLLNREMIESYVDEYKPFDKAGAYGIQELPVGYVKQVIGDEENVIGLSSNSVKDAIIQLENLL